MICAWTAESRAADELPMPLTQDDIRQHYEQEWKTKSDAAKDASQLAYSNPIEDATLYPTYERLIRDLKIRVDGGEALDVGSGSGRWVRFFTERFKPARLTGIDYTRASIDLLRKWAGGSAQLRFEVADITDAKADFSAIRPKGGFDLINIANVLFHIPEPDKFMNALRNAASLLGEEGRIVTTEYLPRMSMRTNWMLVRSRYEFEASAAAAGLRIVDIRPSTFFFNDPMGLDGPDQGVRGHFNKVRSSMQAIQGLPMNDASRAFFTTFLTDLENCLLAYCGERIAAADFPSQKLVTLARA